MIAVLWLGACAARDDGATRTPRPTEDTGSTGIEPTGGSGGTDNGGTGSGGTETASTGHTGIEPPSWDCGALPTAPLAETPIDTLHPSEDFAFDQEGHLISHFQTFLWKTGYPPAAPVAWVPTAGGAGGPASMRMLSTGDLVYHNVDTGSLYRVAPDGTQTVVFAGFGYAGGIEIGRTDLVYVVDLLGIHRIDAFTGDEQLFLRNAPWTSANGIAFSLDWATLFVSAREGIWAVPVDGEGLPNAAPTLWAPAPDGVTEELGMGVDACGEVYVVGSGRLLRYPPAGGAPEELFALPGAHLSNLQWGSGIGGWEATRLYVVNQFGDPAFTELDVGVGARPR